MDCEDRAELTPFYLSGELDAPRTAAFEAHVKSCRECAREMEQNAELDARLREEILGEPIETAALEARIAWAIRQRSSVGWMIAASVAAMLMIGGIGYRMRVDSVRTKLFADAAEDHHSEVVDRERRTWVSDPAAVEALAERAGIEAKAVTVLAPEGYHFDRARLCRLNGARFLHLVYSDGVREFSMFVGPQNASLTGKIECSDLGADHVAAFRGTHMNALIVTDQAGDTALRLARSVTGVL
jgi:anti-sigma factor RsiW